MKDTRQFDVQNESTMYGFYLMGHGGIEKLEYRTDIPIPKLKPGEVLVKVGACGINNTDINLRTGWYDRDVNASLSEGVGKNGSQKYESGNISDAESSWNQQVVVFPRIQGAAIVGKIVAAFSQNDDSRIGERVIIDPQVRDLNLPLSSQLVEYIGGDRDGGFAEYVAVPGDTAHPINSTMSDAELATFPTSYDTAEEMLVRTRLSQGEVVVITGAAGGVGTALVQLSILRGATVIAIAGEEKQDQLLKLGAHHFIARDDENIAEKIRAVVVRTGVDVFADVVGGDLFGVVFKTIKRSGRYATAGAIAGPVQPFDLRDLIYKDIEMHGITCPTPDTFKRIVNYIEQGKLRPVLAKEFNIKNLKIAQGEFIKRRHFGKFVISV